MARNPYVIACLIALAFFAIIETVQPYYFLQDDNRDIFLPLYVHNYRAALDGQLAQYNFFQSLGKPHFATGQVAAFSPVPYVSIFLSNLLFGHVFASLDILVLIYLLLGAASVVLLLRLLGFSGAAGVFAATSWCLSPFNMLTSQSWTTYAPMIGLLPWILIGTLLVYRGRYRLGVPTFVLSHLAVFYIGAPQFFLYAAMIEGLFLVYVVVDRLRTNDMTGREIVRQLAVFGGLTILVTALCMPLLLPMWNAMKASAFRGQGMSVIRLSSCRISLPQLVNGLFTPFTRWYEPLGPEWCENYFEPSYTHQGFPATLLLLAYPWVRRKYAKETRRVTDACFVAGIFLMLGALGLLAPISSVIPIANRFRWPFKFFGFANFLLVAVCTAPAFDALLARLKTSSRRSAVTIVFVAAQFVNLLVLDISFPRQAFFEHLDNVPLREPLQGRLAGTRTVGVGCRGMVGRDQKLYTASTLGFDYAMLWELHYFGGYDPLVPQRNFNATLGLEYTAVLCMAAERIPFDHLRQWGVQTYILNEPLAPLYEPVFARQGLQRVWADVDRVVMVDPHAAPLAGSRDCRMRGLGRVGDDFATTVECRRDSLVALRFLFHPYLTVTVDGQPVPLRKASADFVVVAVPAGIHEIRLAYDDPSIDIGISIALLALGVSIAAVFLWRRRKEQQSGERQ